MAVQTPIPVRFEQVFPHGAYLASEVEPINSFDNGKVGQQEKHKVTDELMWQVTVLDADPEVKGSAKAVKVKIAAPYKPVPPDPPEGHPFTPIEFEQMTITPYVAEVMKGRHKVAYSLSARGLKAPQSKAAKAVKAQVNAA